MRQILLLLTLVFLSMTIFAAEQAAKEDTTPTPPEGALTLDQIPPIVSSPPSQ